MQMFMAHIHQNQFDILEDIIKSYETNYLIALETEPYHHYHFIAYLSDGEYHKLSKNLFIDKYALRGRATKGKPRQYGKVKKTIKDEELAIAYTLKDGNYRTNMDQKTIDKCLKKSYEKTSANIEMEKLCIHLDAKNYGNNIQNYITDFEEIKFRIDGKPAKLIILMDIYRYINETDNKLSNSRNAINNYYLKYLRTTRSIDMDDRILLQMEFNNHI